jgi:hypothetical protein
MPKTPTNRPSSAKGPPSKRTKKVLEYDSLTETDPESCSYDSQSLSLESIGQESPTPGTEEADLVANSGPLEVAAGSDLGDRQRCQRCQDGQGSEDVGQGQRERVRTARGSHGMMMMMPP